MNYRFKIIACFVVVLLACFLSSRPSVAQIVPVQPVVVVSDVPATVIDQKNWLQKTWDYLKNKTGTILFQNIIRNVINDFAKDAATYLGSGGQGQSALMVKEKWGNLWENVGDKALGDFVETFANTAVNDLAGNRISNDVQERCSQSLQKCRDNAQSQSDDVSAAFSVCQSNYTKCLSTGKAAFSDGDCQKLYESCAGDCAANSRNQEACYANCQRLVANCGSARKAPMLGGNPILGSIDICAPNFDFNVMITIGLGLTKYDKVYKPDCSFSEMVNNWSSEFDRLKSMSGADYLKKVSTQFNPLSSELSVAFEARQKMLEYRNNQTLISEKETIANRGWLDIRNFAGDLVGTPGEAEARKKMVDQKVWDNLGAITGDILVDAANIFLNQIALVGWQNLMGTLNESEYVDVASYRGQSGNRQAIEAKISRLTEPVFSEPGRMNVLSDLATCSDEKNPGPSECVIGSRFSDAISSKTTVIDAVRKGQLPGDQPFGFTSLGEDTIPYNQGYPYRSILILRKYRVLPVGWELAAQKIGDMYRGGQKAGGENLMAAKGVPERPNGVSLNDLLACYSNKDSLEGYWSDWCSGLVDPYWVLKIPDYYCAARGYGAYLRQEPMSVDSGIKYCSADEGKTTSKINGKELQCAVNDDCCSDEELDLKNSFLERGETKRYRDFKCLSTCSYIQRKLVVERDNNYCADERSCIKTGKNGSCLFYGYCTEEQRGWLFSQNQSDAECAPYANTCTAFKAKSGKQSFYLANTLDFAQCDESNVGCAGYALTGNYNENNGKLTWQNQPAIHFNQKAEGCRSSEEGCHEFVRLGDNFGANLLPDGSFEAIDNERWKTSGNLVIKGKDGAVTYQGTAALKMNSGQRGLYYGPSDQALLPRGFAFELDRLYTLSAFVYTVSGQVEIGIGRQGSEQAQKLFSTTVNEWEQFTLTVDNNFELNADSFWIKPLPGTEAYLDNVKLEIGSASSYSDYAGSSLTYLKLLPSYLEKACYVNPPSDYSLKAGAPAVCTKYVRRCDKDEVGCQLFTDAETKDQLAAKTKPKDICPQECVGFDTYMQRANKFYEAREEHFIPTTAKACSAQDVGCAGFVNLDKVEAGGENIAYYSDLRQCVKNGETCSNFYTWESTSGSGFQLMVYRLQANQATADSWQQPATADDNNETDTEDSGLCDENIYGLPADHPDYNPDCRQFYAKDGNVSYHLYSRTFACSEKCTPMRLISPNINPLVTDRTACLAADGHWRGDTNDCVVCRGGGVWQEEQQSCIYQAIAEQSVKCAAAQDGCSEYTGNFSGRLKVVFNDTFDKSIGDWGPAGGGASLIGESLIRDGRSLESKTNFLQKNIAGKIKTGKKYELSFLAKSKNADGLIAEITLTYPSGSDGSASFVKNLSLTNDWRTYRLAIGEVQRDDYEQLLISFGERNGTGIYFDSIKLVEASDRYYLIKRSWNTPVSCNQDHLGNPFPLYMLGCRRYLDANNKDRYFRSFDSLCQLSGVGCEAMIDTFNSKYYGKQTFNDDNGNASCEASETDCLTVSADELTYVVYDESKQCDASRKGCQFLGKYNKEKDAYQDGFWLNNPDNYDQTLCRNADVGCEAWQSGDGGQVYFKDPGNLICEYRQANGQFDWYRKRLSYCFASAVFADKAACESACSAEQVCRQDDQGGWRCASRGTCGNKADCAADATCLLTAENVPCDVDYKVASAEQKTIGLGVAADKGQPVGMTVDGWAAACVQAQETCTEYVDPESRISYNLIAKYQTGQNVTLDYNKLYILKSGSKGEAIISCGNNQLQVLTANNRLTATNEVKVPTNFSEEFYVRSLTGGEVNCRVSGDAAELKEAIVAYRLKKTLNNNVPGEVDFVKGQILFNERAYQAGKPQELIYHTSVSPDGRAPIGASNPPGNNANRLLKVAPDRQCAEWLGCKSYGVNPINEREKICYERGICNRLNEAGECINFVDKPEVEQIYPDNLNNIANLSGYTKAAYQGSVIAAGLYPLGAMSEYGDGLVKFDGSFENKFNTGFWSVNGSGDRINAMAPVLRDAAVIQKDLGYSSYRQVPDGQAIGKTSGCIEKEVSGLAGNDYIASAYVFLPFGSQASLAIGNVNKNGGCPLTSIDQQPVDCQGGYGTIAVTDKVGRWVRLIGRFRLSDDYLDEASGKQQSVLLRLCSKGALYFDDVRIASGLQVAENSYLHPSCRLYPDRDALSCDYFNDSGLRKKGWEGYCLEYDPKNPSVCLMWYPLDKVSSEEFEEGAALDIPGDLYYCIEAEDQCRADNPVEPEFACKTFVKVDKNKYWYSRMLSGSAYTIPPNLLTDQPYVAGQPNSLIDFGVDGKNKPGGYKKFDINQNLGSGYYGAYISKNELLYDQATMGISGTKTEKRLYPFVPYYGVSYGGLPVNDPNRKNLCMATIDENKRDKPYILDSDRGSGSDVNSSEFNNNIGAYDDCFVRFATDYSPDTCGTGLNTCCNWDSNNQKCTVDETLNTKYCGKGPNYDSTDGYPCATIMCAETKFSGQTTSCVDNDSDNGYLSGYDPYTVYKKPPKDYSKIFEKNDMGARCGVWEDKNRAGYFGFRTTDLSTDGDSVGCAFDCFNHTNKFSVAKDQNRAVWAINRLFAGLDSNYCYTWKSGQYTATDCSAGQLSLIQNNFRGVSGANQTLSICANNRRPDFQGTLSDLCYVRPEVKDVTINLPKNGADNNQLYVLNGRGWVELRFTSHIDQEQLPLREYTIKWGYKGAKGYDVQMVRSTNMFERPDASKPHAALHFYDYDRLSGADSCTVNGIIGRKVEPNVMIKDNWNISSAPEFTNFAICVLP